MANAIQTDSLTITTNKAYTFLVQPTTPNASEFLPGDGTLVIPDFDSYVMFDFSQRLPDNALEETDLTGAGQVYLTFIDDQRQVKVPSLQEIANINKAVGQVVFKITKDQSSAIFQLTNRYFFVSTAVSVGAAVVNETVLYAGVWQKSNEPDRVTYSQRLQILRASAESSQGQVDLLQKEVDALKKRKANLSERSVQLDVIIADLKNQIGLASEEIAQIESKIEKEKEAQAIEAEATAEAAAEQQKAEEEQQAKKMKRRKAKIVESRKKIPFFKKVGSFFKNPIGAIAFVLNPIAGLAAAAAKKKYQVNYTLELEDTKEKVAVRKFAWIYADAAAVQQSFGTTTNSATYIDDSWFTIKDSEGGRPAPGKANLMVLVDKRLDQFDAKDQFKIMIGTEPVKEPPAEYSSSNKSATAYYLGGGDNYYYKYVVYARDVDPQTKITDLIGEVEL